MITKYSNGFAHFFVGDADKGKADSMNFANPKKSCVHESENEAIKCEAEFWAFIKGENSHV